MTDSATPTRARRMPSAPRARVSALPAAPTQSSPAPEAEAASTPASRPRLGLANQPVPDRVGRYRVVGSLGYGGVGVVYEARDDELGRPVAVKVLRDSSPDNVSRFRREARAMSRVNHPNVATVFEVGECDARLYIAMELVRGRTLRHWLTTGPSWTEVLATVRQAGDGLIAAHAAGLVHRDFKPDNILVGDDGRVRVVDFGLAKHHSEITDELAFDRDVLARELADGGITQDSSLMGTPAYMAPEQFLGEGDARSDQFSLCVVLYEALYGRLPFAGETAEALFHATSRGRMRPWPKRDDLPIALRTVLRRGLSANADDRFASMRRLLDALTQALVRGDGTNTRRPRTKGTRSWKWRIVGMGAGLLLAAGDAALRSEPVDEVAVPMQQQSLEDLAKPAPARRDAKGETVHTRTVESKTRRAPPLRPAQS